MNIMTENGRFSETSCLSSNVFATASYAIFFSSSAKLVSLNLLIILRIIISFARMLAPQNFLLHIFLSYVPLLKLHTCLLYKCQWWQKKCSMQKWFITERLRDPYKWRKVWRAIKHNKNKIPVNLPSHVLKKSETLPCIFSLPK